MLEALNHACTVYATNDHVNGYFLLFRESSYTHTQLRRLGAGEEKDRNGARSASELGAHELYRVRGLESMLWFATRSHAFSPGVAETGGRRRRPRRQ